MIRSRYRESRRQYFIHLLAAASLINIPAAPAAGAQAYIASSVCDVGDFWNPNTPAFRMAAYQTPQTGILIADNGPEIEEQPAEKTVTRTAIVSVTKPAGWSPTYHSDGLSTFTGAQRASAAANGVVWLINVNNSGINQDAALKAILKNGAASGWKGAGGKVYFRAKRGYQGTITDKAFLSLKPASKTATKATTIKAPAPKPRHTVISPQPAAGVDVLVTHWRGTMIDSAMLFVEEMPVQTTIIPYGTAFVVHIGAQDVPRFKEFFEDEGDNVMLAQASASLRTGYQLGHGLRNCAGPNLLGRFPTPKVTAASKYAATIQIEGQAYVFPKGDLLLIVQPAAYRAGVEVALMRLR